MKKKSFFKTLLKTLLVIVLVLVIAVAGYVTYLFVDYERIEDELSLDITDRASSAIPVDKELKMLSYNIGFCAYTDDFSFFMDGGESSWAESEDSVNEVLKSIDNVIKKEDADITLLLEVDKDSTRSYHVDQQQYLIDNAENQDAVFTTNFDSSFLFYPFLEPHGKSLSGMVTLSKYDIESSTRYSLPIETSIMKFFDLDRCYNKSIIPTSNGKKLVLYTAHLSAYTSDGTISDEQIKLLSSDMQAEYENGNYVICGGDLNKDLLMNSSEFFGVTGKEYTWAQPFPTQYLENTALTLVAPLDKENPVATCRNTDEPYFDGQFVVTLDGFIVSDNVKVSESSVVDTKFMYSDHNPVYMNFTLEG